MRILMTGANGCIGQALGQELVRRGHEINALVRGAAHAQPKMSYPCRLFDVGKDQSIAAAALEGVEAIVHLAGEPVAGARWTASKKKAILESRVQGTRAIVAAVAAHADVQKKLKCFVQASAVGFYGERADEWLSETDAPGDDFLADVCKRWENEGTKIKTLRSDIRHVSVRTGIVLSEKGGALAPLLKLFSNGGGAPLGRGTQWMSWIHLKDIVGLYVLAIEGSSDGPLNGVAPCPVTNADFTKALASQLQRWALPAVPTPVLKLTLGEMSAIVLTSTRVACTRATELGYTFAFTNIEEALRQICRDFEPGSAVLMNEQWVASPLKEVFDYFSDAKNLEELTPPYLNFEIKSMSTPTVRAGSLIDYQLKLHGIPMKWRTLIEVWEPQKEFVDRQLKGPYHQWHHTHEFEALGEGTLISDRVVYKLPLGAVGRMVAGFKVAADVKGIFDYRRQKIAAKF